MITDRISIVPVTGSAAFTPETLRWLVRTLVEAGHAPGGFQKYVANFSDSDLEDELRLRGGPNVAQILLDKYHARQLAAPAGKGMRSTESSQLGNAGRQATSDRRIRRVLSAVRDQLEDHKRNEEGKYRRGVMVNAFRAAAEQLEAKRIAAGGRASENETAETVRKIWYENQLDGQ